MKLLRRRGRQRVGKVAVGLVPQLPRFLGLLWRLVRDPRVSRLDRGLVAAVVAYVLMPIDLIPDILGVLGLTDDLFLISLALHRLVTGADEDVLWSNWRGTPAGLESLLAGLDDLAAMIPGPIRRFLREFARRW